ncbi:GPW/gp25 family protein [Micromonospora sp. LZ34]
MGDSIRSPLTTSMARSMAFPFRAGDRGVVQLSPRARSIHESIEQLLLTVPGERVNRPDFGCGVQRLVFGGASPEVAAAAEYVVSAAVQRYLGALVTVDAVRVTVEDTLLLVDVLYTLRDTGEEFVATVAQPLEVAP